MNANCAVAFLNSMIYDKKYALLSDEYIYKENQGVLYFKRTHVLTKTSIPNPRAACRKEGPEMDIMCTAYRDGRRNYKNCCQDNESSIPS